MARIEYRHSSGTSEFALLRWRNDGDESWWHDTGERFEDLLDAEDAVPVNNTASFLICDADDVNEYALGRASTVRDVARDALHDALAAIQDSDMADSPGLLDIAGAYFEETISAEAWGEWEDDSVCGISLVRILSAASTLVAALIYAEGENAAEDVRQVWRVAFRTCNVISYG